MLKMELYELEESGEVWSTCWTFQYVRLHLSITDLDTREVHEVLLSIGYQMINS